MLDKQSRECVFCHALKHPVLLAINPKTATSVLRRETYQHTATLKETRRAIHRKHDIPHLAKHITRLTGNINDR